MTEPHLVAALVLLVTVTLGLIRIFIGSSRVERLMALQLLGTTTVAIVLLIAHGWDLPGLRDLALLLGLLACIVAVAFIKYGGMDSPKPGEDR